MSRAAPEPHRCSFGIGTGRPVPVATGRAVQLLTGKPVEGGTASVPPGQVAVVREPS
ncbi:hypothetical protein [Streptomyces sp. DH10]|uniref:hypothetical protein n=1 Tax=Streptomyces sp. DH10 TaxID=3040121 RepID=UPI0024418DB3|nr:hypothetical protein [Streptomyces sp. DH10]MDG9709385.1 hypothetical protein [Streptomyces sp. DH10]